MPAKLPQPQSTLSLRELNRATLTRQLLFERETLGVVEVVERLAGMQAQYSPSPYIGLWTRLLDFRHEQLTEAILSRQIIKASLMRWTLHLASARDYPYFSRAVTESRLAGWKSTGQKRGIDTVALHKSLMDFISEPRPLDDITEHLAMQVPAPEGLSRRDLWYLASSHGGLVHTPPSGTWRYFGKNSYIDSRLWLEGLEEPPLDEAMRWLVQRYLAAFGPASRADILQWGGVRRMGMIDAALQSLGDELTAFKDEKGTVLYDLGGAPRPGGDTPVPPRFLPKWDNLLLAYQDRERVLPARYRKSIIKINGDVLPTFLVDGVVAGTWATTRERDAALLRLEPLEAVAPDTIAALEAEAQDLIRFIELDASIFAVEVGS